MMERKRVIYGLSDAWEEWIIEVPDGTLDSEILNNSADIEFVELINGGNSLMTPEGVEDCEE